MVQQLKPPFVQTPRPRRILVIGGGVGGLAALRALVDEDGVRQQSRSSSNGNGIHDDDDDDDDAPFDEVQLIERRDDIGGVWYLDEKTVQLEKSHAKGTANDQWPIRSAEDTKPRWPSPAYPALRGNVLPRFLSFAGTDPFPPPDAAATDAPSAEFVDPYPTLAETHDYLRRIAQPLRPHIRCGIECLGVWELPNPEDADKNRWAVRIRDWTQGGVETTEYWDAVVLSVGWTDKPIYPRVDGMAEAREAGFVEHCKWYRGPEPYAPEERIVVVGNGNSGNDVCAQLAARRTHGKHEPVIRICRHKAWFFYVSLPDRMIRDVPAIDRLTLRRDDAGARKLDVHLIDGEVVRDVDRVISAAGYEIGQFPFAHILDRDLDVQEAQALKAASRARSSDWTPEGSVLSSAWRSISDAPHGTMFENENGTNPSRVSGLFWQILHERASTLALVNLTVTSIPFWTSDMQSHCVRAAWDGSLPLPSTLEGRGEYERKRLAFIQNLHRQKVENLRKADEAWQLRKQQLAADATEDAIAATYEAPDHIFLLPYHILGTMVADYLPPLRDMAIEAKPAWRDRLPSFVDVQDVHDGMYGRKLDALKAKKAAREAVAVTEAQQGGQRKDVTI